MYPSLSLPLLGCVQAMPPLLLPQSSTCSAPPFLYWTYGLARPRINKFPIPVYPHPFLRVKMEVRSNPPLGPPLLRCGAEQMSMSRKGTLILVAKHGLAGPYPCASYPFLRDGGKGCQRGEVFHMQAPLVAKHWRAT